MKTEYIFHMPWYGILIGRSRQRWVCWHPYGSEVW